MGVYSCLYVLAWVCTGMCLWRGQRLPSGVFLSLSALYLETDQAYQSTGLVASELQEPFDLSFHIAAMFGSSAHSGY